MKLFHGTTWNRFKQILECGYIGNGSAIWDVSEEDTTYFWTEAFLRNEGYEDEDLFTAGIRYASESADIALSQERVDLRRVVLVFDSADLERMGELTPDWSHHNMDHCMQFYGKIPVSLIKSVLVDPTRLDFIGLYFVGLARSLNTWPETKVMGFDYGLDEALVSISKDVYEKLAEWYMEDFNFPERFHEAMVEVKL